MAINFNDMLNTKAGDIERPPLLPVGTYRGRVIKIPSIETRGKDPEWDIIEFPILLIAPGEDVNIDDLDAAGGLNKSTVRRKAFVFNKDDEIAFKKTLFQLKTFCIDHLKIEANDDTPLKELLNNSMNQECNVFIKWTPDKNDKDMNFDNIAKTAPLD